MNIIDEAFNSMPRWKLCGEKEVIAALEFAVRKCAEIATDQEPINCSHGREIRDEILRTAGLEERKNT